jgi:hypothetical protein
VRRVNLAARGQAAGPLVHTSTSASQLASPLPGVASSFGLTVTHTVHFAQANPRPAEHNITEFLLRARSQHSETTDILGFASGRVEVALTLVYESGHRPVQTEHRLLSLLYSRAKAHKL